MNIIINSATRATDYYGLTVTWSAFIVFMTKVFQTHDCVYCCTDSDGMLYFRKHEI